MIKNLLIVAFCLIGGWGCKSRVKPEVMLKVKQRAIEDWRKRFPGENILEEKVGVWEVASSSRGAVLTSHYAKAYDASNKYIWYNNKVIGGDDKDYSVSTAFAALRINEELPDEAKLAADIFMFIGDPHIEIREHLIDAPELFEPPKGIKAERPTATEVADGFELSFWTEHMGEYFKHYRLFVSSSDDCAYKVLKVKKYPIGDEEGSGDETSKADDDLLSLIDKATSSKAKGGAEDTTKTTPKVEEKTTTAPAGLPATPSKNDVLAAMKKVTGKVKACAKGQTGKAVTSIVFSGSSGKATSAKVIGGEFAGTPAASCIASAAQSASVPKFKQSSFSFTYPFLIK